MAGEIRQRTNKKSSKKTSTTVAPRGQRDKQVEKLPPGPPEEPTLWDTFTSHPLIVVLPIFLVPYLVYTSYYYFLLQRPDILIDYFGIDVRPAVAVTEERQFLIIASMSSGTVQASSDLYSHLNLEVGHEVTDTKWNFVRDGTVSWFHGIRFLPQPELSIKMRSMLALCANFTGSMGFHPAMYKESGCSKTRKWDRCWTKACFSILNSEWGCGLADTCETPFRRTLHQVRHPLRTVESLVTKFCEGGFEGTVHKSFLFFATHLFPSRDWSNDTCIEAAANYVILYNHAAINARKQGVVSHTYKVEDTSPCQIAKMAGLFEAESTVYPPNIEKIGQRCADALHTGQETMKSTKHKINEDFVNLDWKDLVGGQHGSVRPHDDGALVKELMSLTEELGYDPKQPRTEDDKGIF
jgi:hypothetical protein